MNAEETLFARSSDVGQEKRETYSFSTQLSQLYHQLDSYHLGTNRALFFVLPRPNTLETEHTFVNGIRNIEGIQEFFLVVARPKSLSGFCVEAYLETGHIGKVPYSTTQEVAGTEIQTTWFDSYHAAPKGDDDETTVYDAADRSWAVDTFYPGLGYKIKSAVLTSPAPTVRYNKDPPNLVDSAPHISASNPDYVTVSGKVHSGFANYAFGSEDRWEEITYPFTVALTLVKHEVVQQSTDTLFMTARYLNCCDRRVGVRAPSHGIVYEKDLPAMARREREATTIERANSLHNALEEGIRRSTSDADHRYAQPVPLAATDFAARSLLESVPGTREVDVTRISHLPPELRDKLGGLAANVKIADLLVMPLKMQQALFSLTPEEAVQLRGALTGSSHRVRQARDAWMSSDEQKRLFKPDARAPDDDQASE